MIPYIPKEELWALRHEAWFCIPVHNLPCDLGQGLSSLDTHLL